MVFGKFVSANGSWEYSGDWQDGQRCGKGLYVEGSFRRYNGDCCTLMKARRGIPPPRILGCPDQCVTSGYDSIPEDTARRSSLNPFYVLPTHHNHATMQDVTIIGIGTTVMQAAGHWTKKKGMANVSGWMGRHIRGTGRQA